MVCQQEIEAHEAEAQQVVVSPLSKYSIVKADLFDSSLGAEKRSTLLHVLSVSYFILPVIVKFNSGLSATKV